MEWAKDSDREKERRGWRKLIWTQALRHYYEESFSPNSDSAVFYTGFLFRKTLLVLSNPSRKRASLP